LGLYDYSVGIRNPWGVLRVDEMREFMMVLRRALLLVVRWIEKRYGIM
jgi:hypothetical protein